MRKVEVKSFDIELTGCSSGWTNINFLFDKKAQEAYISGVMSSSMDDLIKILFYFHKENHEDYNEWEAIKCNEKGVPQEASFDWDEEGTYVQWILKRKSGTGYSFLVDVSITLEALDNGRRLEDAEYCFTIPYRELCRVAARTMQAIFKKRGIRGYEQECSTEVNIKEYLFVKAVALGREKDILTFIDRDGNRTSNFQSELEILAADVK